MRYQVRPRCFLRSQNVSRRIRASTNGDDRTFPKVRVVASRNLRESVAAVNETKSGSAEASSVLVGSGNDVCYPLLVRVVDAAAITGLPVSLIRKSFIDERKRPANIPPPPPHKRIGRSVYILRDGLMDWVRSLDEYSAPTRANRERTGRPTVAERRARRAHAGDNILNSPPIERSPRKASR